MRKVDCQSDRLTKCWGDFEFNHILDNIMSVAKGVEWFIPWKIGIYKLSIASLDNNRCVEYCQFWHKTIPSSEDK